eukprot:3430444-Rhodomonas_salina.1
MPAPGLCQHHTPRYYTLIADMHELSYSLGIHELGARCVGRGICIKHTCAELARVGVPESRAGTNSSHFIT